MTIDDRYPQHEQHSEDVPTMTLAEPRTAARDASSEYAERSPQSVDAPVDASVDASAGAPADASAERLATSQSDGDSLTAPSPFADGELAGLRARWDGVQAGFVDDPRECVHEADALVSDVVGQLTTGFTEARSRLEQQWSRGEEASTEDLRVALTRYRDFFERLLAI